MSEQPTKAKSDDRYLLSHDYDGIQEYDNPLPAWWIATFYGTILFAAVYLIGFHVAHWGHTPAEKYRAALAEYQTKREAREAADLASVSETILATDAADAGVVERGREIFQTRCATCHAPDGRGLIGPNLTDDYQLHGSSRLDIYKTVHGGAPGTAMPAWGEQLASDDVVAVVAYAITLRNTNAPGGKAAQGNKVARFQ
ncbi:MAG TPA: cbb3-type cytochrome c oxidase N-terminal domain-containing protein [Kofleriaceae bacterium]|nr:cbb3-type cytochrome c oxidase N-terminal domain-containing protein [Kofleriaceae bacterium]